MRLAARRILPSRETPARAVAYILFLHLSAATVLVAALLHDRHELVGSDGLRLALLVGLATVNVEAGRRAEGGRIDRDRPHKALSAWAFAAALLLPVSLAMLVVVPTYWHARLRGIRMPLWKWIGSAEIVAMSGALAHQVWRTWGPPGGLSDGPRAPVAVAAAAVVFVLAEAAGLFVASRLNRLEDELVLRRHLASRSFYLTELAVLATGTVAATLIVLAPWLLPLELPTYLLLQQAVLHESLRAQARTDPKTGLLSASAWSEEAARRLRRLTSNGTPVAVVLLDLDHFKAVNDSYGHLVGDRVLVHLAQLLARQLRPGDLLGRFGGEEFCLLLHGLSRPETAELAERIRQTVASSPESQGGPAVTISAGVSWHDAPVALDDALARADEALYRSKRRGRDQVQFAEPEAVRLAPVPQLTRAG